MSNEASGGQGTPALVEQLASIGRELRQIGRLSKLESKDRVKLVGIIKLLRSWLDEDISLDIRRFAGLLKSVSIAYLDRESNLVAVDWRGQPTRWPLEQLDPGIFLAVVRDTAPRLLSMVATKAEQVIKSRKPKILALLQGERAHSLPFGKRIHRLFIRNSGGDSRNLQVLVRANGSTHRYGPYKIEASRQIGLDLDRVGEIDDSASLGIEVSCKDMDQRRYRGTAVVERIRGEWQEVDLSPLQSQKRGSRAKLAELNVAATSQESLKRNQVNGRF